MLIELGKKELSDAGLVRPEAVTRRLCLPYK